MSPYCPKVSHKWHHQIKLHALPTRNGLHKGAEVIPEAGGRGSLDGAASNLVPGWWLNNLPGHTRLLLNASAFTFTYTGIVAYCPAGSYVFYYCCYGLKRGPAQPCCSPHAPQWRGVRPAGHANLPQARIREERSCQELIKADFTRRLTEP